MSPDGKLVAFKYVDHDKTQSGLGLLDWQSRKVTRIPNPLGLSLSLPSFSPDGARLLVSSGKIVTIDLATLQVAQVVEVPGGARPGAIFQPGRDNVLYSGAVYPQDLRLVNLADHTERTILEAKSGFYTIFKPSFVGPDEIVFVGMGPKDLRLREEVKGLIKNATAGALTYRLRFGDSPKLALSEIHQHEIAIDEGTGGVLNLSASRNGEKIFFTGRLRKGKMDEEVFVLQGGDVRQMTNLGNRLESLAAAYDGSTVAFTSASWLRDNHDLFILDVRTGAVTKMGLQQRLATHPDFIQQ